MATYRTIKRRKCSWIFQNWKELLLLIGFIYFLNTLIAKFTDSLVGEVEDDTALNVQQPPQELLDLNHRLPKTTLSVIDKLKLQFKPLEKEIEHYNEEIMKFRLKRFQTYQSKEPFRQGIGEKGEAVVLTGKEKKEADRLFQKEAFNIVLSNKISLQRSVGDSRRKECRNMTYSHDLPSASVVIIFINEAWSPLLRTVYSVINRSPPHLLHEVVLVDDFSDRPELGSKLETYINATWPDGIVRIVRLKQRCGIMKARTEGARAATGEVVVFLDSHCEASTMWLEPLLTRLKASPNSVVCPIIDVINDHTLEYSQSSGLNLGGFSWSGHFTWIDIPQRELDRQQLPTDHLRSPTMAGGLLATRRDFFFKIGAYDETMRVWGGENLEISFRTWMCGGKLEFIPCSRVGHIFRSAHPYTFPGKEDTHGINTLRMAHVWMDSYIRLFYAHRPESRYMKYGNITERKVLRSTLKCKDFSWYLKYVFPEKFVLDQDVRAFGQLKSEAKSLCLDMLSQDERKPTTYLGVYVCHPTKANYVMNQMFSFTYSGQLRREDVCCEAPEAGKRVLLKPCKYIPDQAQMWTHKEDGTMRNDYSGLCLDVNGLKHSEYMLAQPCTGVATQKWTWVKWVLRP